MNTIRNRITRAIEALRAACAQPEPDTSPRVPLVPIHGNPQAAPILVTSTITGSFNIVDCSLTPSRHA